MRDDIAVVVAREDVEHPEVDADGADIVGFQDDSCPMIHPHRTVADPPAAVHLQMRVNAGRPDPDEKVLAPTEHLVHHLAGQVDGGVPRHPDIAARQGATGQVLSQCGRRMPNGVTLGHRSPQPQPARCPDETGLAEPSERVGHRAATGLGL